MERMVHTKKWWQYVDLRGEVQDGVNKGESHNDLVRVVFFNRLGEIRN